MLKNLLGLREKATPGREAYGLAVARARARDFYVDHGVDDRIDARFELYTLHVLLLVLRLRDEDTAPARDAAQDLFDTYVSALDNALRELGVGDVAVSKKMRKLGEALYGRMQAYETPLRAGDAAGLAEALERNVYAGAGADHAPWLARYALESRQRLAAQSVESCLKAPDWAGVSA
ncbi:ubiquinol-cytochrome C chaperone family protein [Brevundimonas halotolerans]|uniref:Cytochrome b pre-mRNA-processing protein 3 n=1 Tax=Brevundimonas halotolerans TaxID=69670 RepID=A0A7W9E6Y6_9CAUL|nr:ubiquinol-cytochrome C chaperone family protein [Brevundimonas halotolerans]MBB5659484.1 cytochrome b pre-mRNA-processing protein 3 [Brevundimonas halotolerans]